MNTTFCATEVEIAYHPEGFRIDKTASPLNRYTRWEVVGSDQWRNPRPVCFDSLPVEGWVKMDHFDWGESDVNNKL